LLAQARQVQPVRLEPKMKYLKLFEEQSVDDLLQKKQDIEDMRELGVLSDEEYRTQLAGIRSRLNLYTKSKLKTGSQNPPYSAAWFDDLRTSPELRWLMDVVATPEYAALVEKGVSLASSYTQLLNHTLVFARGGTNRNTKTEFAIGFFGSIQVVRRLVPKTGTRDMDIIMKRFDDLGLNELEFFKRAMAWTIEAVDFTDRAFSSKKTVSATAKRNQADEQLRELVDQLVEESLADISGRTQSQTKINVYYSIGGGYASSKRAATSALTKYFSGGTSTLTISGVHSLGQDEITVLSKPRLKLKWDDNMQFSFDGHITNLDNFNLLPLTGRIARSISINAKTTLNPMTALESLDRVLAKLAEAGIKSVYYINVYGIDRNINDLPNQVRDWTSGKDKITELVNKHGIEWLSPR
jgi:hypothetical protein